MDNNTKGTTTNNNSTNHTVTVIISSGTMREINGERIGCDVVKASGTYILNGEEKTGPTAMLSPSPQKWVTVGVGSELTIKESTWRVFKIDEKNVYLEEVIQ